MKYQYQNYDYLIVGAGLFSLTIARLLTNNHKKCLIIEKRNIPGGNIVDYKDEDTQVLVHQYGPHIFHTSDKECWDFINKYSEFDNFKLEVKANYNNEIYDLPFNMNTFVKMFKDVDTPNKAKEAIENDKKEYYSNHDNIVIKNLEEQAISMVGPTIYNKLIKGYTEKQWGKKCTELPADIIKRLPLRFTFNNNYFNDIYQGMPSQGYCALINNLIKGNENDLGKLEIICNIDFKRFKQQNPTFNYNNIIYTGPIDELMDYQLGELEWRSLSFTNKKISSNEDQGTLVINHTSNKEDYTRVFDHKYFYPHKIKENQDSIITYERPQVWNKFKERYYPVNTQRNSELYNKYKELAEKEYPNIIFGGRLGLYKYFDMDDSIIEAINLFKKIKGRH